MRLPPACPAHSPNQLQLLDTLGAISPRLRGLRLAAGRVLRLVAFVTLFGLTIAPLRAGEWHSGANLVCSDCHSTHGSEHRNLTDGSEVPGRNNGPQKLLLLRPTATELCLSCHAGTQGPGTSNVLTPTYPAAAGSLMQPLVANANGHDLGIAAAPPGGTGQEITLGCTTCHDPHGNASYRNLRPDPLAVNQAPATVVANQTKLPGQFDPAEVYVGPNIVYKSGVSKWCISCHGEPLEGSDHPDDKPIFGTWKASYSSWVAVTLPRVPVHSPTDDAIPSTDDRVICTSCHKAHGSAHPKAMIWADGITSDSTCLECHDMGPQ